MYDQRAPELSAGAHRRFFRINTFPASNVYQRKRDVSQTRAYLELQLQTPPFLGNLIPPASLTDALKSHIFAARFEIFNLHGAGRGSTTESRRPSVCAVSSALALLSLDRVKTAAADNVEPASGPNTCGCLRTSFWLSARRRVSAAARSRLPTLAPLSSICSEELPGRCSEEPQHRVRATPRRPSSIIFFEI